MTDISVGSVAYQVEKRSWLLSPHGVDPGMTPSVTIAPAAFTQAQHYPNGYIPSGTVLGLAASGTYAGLYVPYLSTASDGSQTAVGILFSEVKLAVSNYVIDPTKVLGGAMMFHGFVDAAKLPFTSSNAAAGGFLSSAARTSLSMIKFLN